jgi:hypothetical protein
MSNPVQIPRPALRRTIPLGAMNIVRRRTQRGVDIVISVGGIHITQRNPTDSYFYRCRICGHPYDHNGTPHSAYQAERGKLRKGPIRTGEALTGPDGLVYFWDGKVWKPR